MGVVSKYAERLGQRDLTLKCINLANKDLTDSRLREVVDCLLECPDIVTQVWPANNKLMDETGVKLAQYVAASYTVDWLGLSYNQFSLVTYLALAKALHVNSSLSYLGISDNQVTDKFFIDVAFINALRFNPIRPVESYWYLYKQGKDDYKRLKDVAQKSTPPSMLEFLLCIHSNS